MGPAQRDPNRLPPGIKSPERRKIWTPDAGDWATFDKYGAETNGEYTELTVSLAPGGANASHWHGSYSETFTGSKGEVGIYSASTGRVILQPGDSRTVPAGEVHHFFNPGKEEVELKIVLRPSVEGFEKGLYILYGLARDGKTHSGGIPNNLIHGSIVFVMSDMWPAGIAGVILKPVIIALAALGRALGMEEDLLRRYWY